jgi:hypothetical protein
MGGLNTSLLVGMQALEATQGALECHEQQHRQCQHAGLYARGSAVQRGPRE